MKYLLMMLLIASCGKNSMPAEKDLRDSDGDGEVNSEEVSELAKYTSDITPIEIAKVEMRIILAKSITTDLKIKLSNQIDIIRHSRELLVKNPKKLYPDDYFSEWSKLKIDSDKIPSLPDQASFRVDLCFNQMKTPPHKLLLVSKEGSRVLSDWSPLIHLELSKKETLEILSGESYISLARDEKKFQNSSESQDESVKNKTYRVFWSDGTSTKIYYVSKEFSFERFLDAKGIYPSQKISNQNLLTTRHTHGLPEWWVNEINGKDKVVIKDDLKSLSDFYIQGLEKQILNVRRNDGAATKSVILTNKEETLTLLKIRATRKVRTFAIITEKSSTSDGGGGGMNGGGGGRLACNNYHRKISAEANVEVTEMELREALLITSNGVENSMSPSQIEVWKGNDDKGSFFEIAFKTVNNIMEIKFRNLENSTFVKVGLYNTTCQGTNLRTNPSNYEAFLDLSIEAYVERL